MKWEGGRRSTNIEDRRGLGVGTIGGGGIGMLLIVLAVSCITGTNPLALLQMAAKNTQGRRPVHRSAKGAKVDDADDAE